MSPLDSYAARDRGVSRFLPRIGAADNVTESVTPRGLSGPLAYTRADRSRSALPITETELKAIAAAAIVGVSRIPKAG